MAKYMQNRREEEELILRLFAFYELYFSECGSNYIVSDLQRFKEDILNGM